MQRYHERNVQDRSFTMGDLVLCKIQTIMDRHKLSPIWEGPFIIAEVLQPNAYRLQQ